MQERYQSRFLTVLVVSLTLALAAQGGRPDAWAQDAVKVGLATSLTGVWQGPGTDVRDGFILFMEQIGNKAAGRPLETIVGDVGSLDTNRALEVAKRLLTKDHIHILAGIMGSGEAYALARLLEKEGVPFVISVAGSDDLTMRKNNPFIMRVSFTNSMGGHVLGKWAYEQGFRKAVVFASDFVAGYEHAGGMLRTFKGEGGKVLKEIWVPVDTVDFKPLLAQIDPDADVVMSFFAGNDAIRFVQQFKESDLGKKIQLMGTGPLVDETLLSKLNEAAEGVITASHWSYLVDNPENREFKEAFTKKYGRTPTQFAEQGYLTAKVIPDSLAKTGGQAKGSELVKVMRTLEVKAPRGLVKFDGFGSPVQTIYVRKVQQVDGKWQNVPIKSYPAVTQFWTWTADDFMKMPAYGDMKGKWTQ